MKKIVIFGAGNYGRKAFLDYGKENVAFFIDNNVTRHGTLFCGKEIKSLAEVLADKEHYRLVVANSYYASICRQLETVGITDYEVYEADILHGFYETEDLIVNPYSTLAEAKTEKEWSCSTKLQYMRQGVYDEVERIYDKQLLFNHIEVETINRCNGNCSFCPVNRTEDPREKRIMTQELFESIVEQLADIHYCGRFTTFSNNEPLLDERIIEFNQFARRKLPQARMHLFTNGTLLTLDKFIALAEVLDELVIDNYQQDLKLIRPCEEIREYCEKHPALKKKVTIVLRKPYEILTTRGGTAPNRQEIPEYGKDRCVFPFKQIIVRPDGMISLCCNDALGQYTLGDLNRESLLDIWYGPKFAMVRKCMYEGREKWGNCKYCDTFSVV